MQPRRHVGGVHEVEPGSLCRHSDEPLQRVRGRAVDLAGFGLEMLGTEPEVREPAQDQGRAQYMEPAGNWSVLGSNASGRRAASASTRGWFEPQLSGPSMCPLGTTSPTESSRRRSSRIRAIPSGEGMTPSSNATRQASPSMRCGLRFVCTLSTAS